VNNYNCVERVDIQLQSASIAERHPRSRLDEKIVLEWIHIRNNFADGEDNGVHPRQWRGIVVELRTQRQEP